MVLPDFRDIMIIIAAFFFIGANLAFMIIMVLLYRKVGPIIKSVQGVTADIQSISSTLSGGALRPVIRAAGLAAGARKAISRFRGRSGGPGKEK